MPTKNSGCRPLLIRLVLILLAGFAFIALIIYISDTPYWKWLFLLIPAIFIGAWFYDAKEKKETQKKATVFLVAGKLIFPAQQEEFSAYYQSSLRSKKKKEPIDIINEFASGKGLLHVIDWRGEDNEGEIEEFIETLLGQKITWTNTSKLRSTVPIDDQRDGEFIGQVFKAIDKDLKTIGKKLLFLGQGDSYEYTIVDAKAYTNINKLKLDGLPGPSAL